MNLKVERVRLRKWEMRGGEFVAFHATVWACFLKREESSRRVLLDNKTIREVLQKKGQRDLKADGRQKTDKIVFVILQWLPVTAAYSSQNYP